MLLSNKNNGRKIKVMMKFKGLIKVPQILALNEGPPRGG